jgi:hypothetical protein
LGEYFGRLCLFLQDSGAGICDRLKFPACFRVQCFGFFRGAIVEGGEKATQFDISTSVVLKVPRYLSASHGRLQRTFY